MSSNLKEQSDIVLMSEIRSLTQLLSAHILEIDAILRDRPPTDFLQSLADLLRLGTNRSRNRYLSWVETKLITDTFHPCLAFSDTEHTVLWLCSSKMFFAKVQRWSRNEQRRKSKRSCPERIYTELVTQPYNIHSSIRSGTGIPLAFKLSHARSLRHSLRLELMKSVPFCNRNRKAIIMAEIVCFCVINLSSLIFVTVSG